MFGLLRRPTIIAATVGGALGIPYLMHTDAWNNISSSLASTDTNVEKNTSGTIKITVLDPQEADVAVSDQPIDGGHVKQLDEVFNFEVSKAWVLNRWPRVFTGLTEPDPKREGRMLQGYRVPLVTGTSQQDVAGSLTYYFNSSQKLQQIRFDGTTGDLTRILKLLGTRYGFRRQNTADPSVHLYTASNFGRSPSRLEVRESHQQRSTAPHRRFEVALLMQR